MKAKRRSNRRRPRRGASSCCRRLGEGMSLDRWRAEIDGLDEVMVELANLRAMAAMRIGDLKRKKGIRIHDAVRERDVLRRVNRLNPGPLSARALRDIYRRIMAACLECERQT